MKKNILIIIVLAAALFSCEKDYQHAVAVYDTNLGNSAYLKVINVTVGAKKNYVYSDGTPLTGAVLNSGSAFPTTTNYAVIAPGNRTITIKDTTAGTIQPTITVTGNFVAGGYYTIFTNDTLTNANYVLTQDMISVPSDTSARLRFANMIFSSSVLPNVDVFSTKQQKNLFTDLASGQVSDFIPVPSAISDTLYIRAAGTTTNLAQLNAFTPGAQRSYTLVFAGTYQTVSGSGAQSALLFTNR